MENYKYMQLDTNTLSDLKFMVNAASKDESHPVLTALHIRPDGDIVSADGFRLHWLHDQELSTRILETVGVTPDEHEGALIKVVKCQKTTVFEPEQEDGRFPDVMRIIPPTAPATFTIDAKKLADVMDGLEWIASFSFNEEAQTLEVFGTIQGRKGSPDYKTYALLHTEESQSELGDWSPRDLPALD